jgi:hypothetical protein
MAFDYGEFIKAFGTSAGDLSLVGEYSFFQRLFVALHTEGDLTRFKVVRQTLSPSVPPTYRQTKATVYGMVMTDPSSAHSWLDCAAKLFFVRGSGEYAHPAGVLAGLLLGAVRLNSKLTNEQYQRQLPSVLAEIVKVQINLDSKKVSHASEYLSVDLLEEEHANDLKELLDWYARPPTTAYGADVAMRHKDQMVMLMNMLWPSLEETGLWHRSLADIEESHGRAGEVITRAGLFLLEGVSSAIFKHFLTPGQRFALARNVAIGRLGEAQPDQW